MSVRTTVVVPAYQAWDTLPATLEALRPQVERADRELVLVESSGTIGTGEIERRWPWVRPITLPKRTLPGRARNLALEAAAGELIAFTDADAVPAPDWLDELERALAPELDGVAGAILNGAPSSRLATADYLLEFSDWLPSRHLPLLHGATCNLLLRRSVLDGGFPEQLWPGEDTVVTFGLGSSGRLAFAPRARVHHAGRKTLRGFLRHQRQLGAAFASVSAAPSTSRTGASRGRATLPSSRASGSLPSPVASAGIPPRPGMRSPSLRSSSSAPSPGRRASSAAKRAEVMNAGGLRSRPLLALLAAEAVSTTGSQLSLLAIPWFVLETTDSPTRMSVVLAAEFLGTALLGIPSGSVAARLGARTTLLACDLVRAPLVALVPLLHAAELLTFPVLASIAFVLGALWTPAYSSQRVILPELLGEDDRVLAQANALLRATTSTTILVGPPVAGLLIAAVGASNVLWIDAATFLVSFALVALFVPPGHRAPEAEDARGLLAGVRFLWRDRLLRPWTLAGAAFELGWQALFVVIPVLAFVRFDDPKVAGWLWAAYGAGGIAGNVLVVPVLRRLDPYGIVVVAKIAQLVVLWILVFDLQVVAFGVAIAVASFLASFVSSPVAGVQTARTPAALRPHAMAAYLTVTLVAGMVGLATAGPTLEHVSFRAVFVGIAVVHTVAAIPFVLAALRERPRPGR